MAPTMRKLTEKEDAFCRLIARGVSQYKAYIEAYKPENEDRKLIDPRASTLVRKPKVVERIAELRQVDLKEWAWTRQRSVEALMSVVSDNGKDRVAAMKELNAMHGYQEARKIELNATGINFTFNLGDQ